MKDKIAVVAFSTVIISILLSSVVCADWSTLGTGYALTSNVGEQIPSGTIVTITAGTLDPTVTIVTFRWYAPDGTLEYDETIATYTDGSVGYWDGKPELNPATIRYAKSTHTVVTHGEWRVDAIFHAAVGDVETRTSLDVTQSQSFFVVPEIALGTIGALCAMAGALGLFVITKKRQQE